MHRHGKNSQASATPACDGRHVFIAFMVKDAIWLTAGERKLRSPDEQAGAGILTTLIGQGCRLAEFRQEADSTLRTGAGIGGLGPPADTPARSIRRATGHH